MRKMIGLSLGIFLLSAGSGAMLAQMNPDGTTNPPKVLLIQREFLKPGKQGSLHEKSESAFVRAMEAAKWPEHYFAMNSMSGPSRALFIIGYDSFAALEKDNDGMMHDKTLSAAFDRAAIADGDLLSKYDSSIWTYEDDMSLRGPVKIEQMRYFELDSITVKPGHHHDWFELANLYKKGYADIPDAHWAIWSLAYGSADSDVYLIAIPMRSLSEVDQMFADQSKFRQALGADGMKRLSELSAACIKSSDSQLFEMAPKMSYPPAAWAEENPGLWKQKAEASAKKEAAKPKQ
ncbi:hypothetical protein GCM10011507_08600 [Edaphobacter acidisoli]|uniref:Uncharacterized protein n=1 Tax=Edaphobacter acidisoli TaxID=2040573 RepID=A0A916RK69_9BACT|nr:hypothetical protein [Edaphobacter acidisoli]GGA59451.1 hypothetical protein GCM10011507_08600 [Edaphobacter acidisoli]